MNHFKKCVDFLEKNGWQQTDVLQGYPTMLHENKIAIDLKDDEIFFIDDSGDFLRLPCNFYALLGALIHFSVIDRNYKT